MTIPGVATPLRTGIEVAFAGRDTRHVVSRVPARARFPRRADPRVLWNNDTGSARCGRPYRRGGRVEASERWQSKGIGCFGGWRFAHQSARPGVLSADLAVNNPPRTIAVVISLGLSRASYTNSTDDLLSVIASFLAVVVIAITIFLLRLRGSRTAAARPRWHRYRSAAFRIHSVLPWRPDFMVRRKRAVAIRDPFRVMSRRG